MIRFSNGTKTTSPQNSIAQVGIILFINSVEDGILVLEFNLKVSGGAGGYCPLRLSLSLNYSCPPPPQNHAARTLDVQTAADV